MRCMDPPRCSSVRDLCLDMLQLSTEKEIKVLSASSLEDKIFRNSYLKLHEPITQRATMQLESAGCRAFFEILGDFVVRQIGRHHSIDIEGRGLEQQLLFFLFHPERDDSEKRVAPQMPEVNSCVDACTNHATFRHNYS